ncbi:hypothetical protein EYF80_011547 [Liparis tanakae]|uniref:Uncharacterized protein n=1 Tax=Liparis tanakae TaxID=230148 RepID=A0A4Z2IKP4_9TELE|nr:hypothetical protein EYF80_011547 [Liparis tanakae]
MTSPFAYFIPTVRRHADVDSLDNAGLNYNFNQGPEGGPTLEQRCPHEENEQHLDGGDFYPIAPSGLEVQESWSKSGIWWTTMGMGGGGAAPDGWLTSALIADRQLLEQRTAGMLRGQQKDHGTQKLDELQIKTSVWEIIWSDRALVASARAKSSSSPGSSSVFSP